MAYCTNAHVRAICDTDITDGEIDDLIDECDDLLDLELDMSSFTTNVRRALSRTYTAIRCFLKDPSSEGLGEYRGDRTYALQKLNEEFEKMKKLSGGGIAMKYHSEALPTLE
jgi:hypothetical protein